ncbi:FRG domain-containing protein [[Clostridium] innocuum]|nr:FRG domain-containing protein [[Clostridium] innocuum]
MTESFQKQAQTLYKNPRFHDAFHRELLHSLRVNGYYDYHYISGNIARADILVSQTPAQQLQYQENVPDREILHYTLKHAVPSGSRHLLLKELLKAASYPSDLQVKESFLFDSESVQLVEITSLPQYIETILKYRKKHISCYFRGHQDMNYRLMPSLFREHELAIHEDSIYKQTLIEYPTDFQNCNTHFEKLVKMQHYQICTRLLDVTSNPLVALFFACENASTAYGRVLMFESDTAPLFPDSDKVCMLSSLGFLKEEVRQALRRESSKAFLHSSAAQTLLHEIQREQPAFQPIMKQDDLKTVQLVKASLDNERIRRQNGLFFLCGNYADDDEELPLALQRKLMHYQGKQMVFYIKKKKQILEELQLVHMSHKDLYGNLQEAAWDIMNTCREQE